MPPLFWTFWPHRWGAQTLPRSAHWAWDPREREGGSSDVRFHLTGGDFVALFFHQSILSMATSSGRPSFSLIHSLKAYECLLYVRHCKDTSLSFLSKKESQRWKPHVLPTCLACWCPWFLLVGSQGHAFLPLRGSARVQPLSQAWPWRQLGQEKREELAGRRPAFASPALIVAD